MNNLKRTSLVASGSTKSSTNRVELIERYKARLVVKGYNQIEGIDFINTFSSIAKITSLRDVWALTPSINLFLHQLDVDNFILHVNLKE